MPASLGSAALALAFLVAVAAGEREGAGAERREEGKAQKGAAEASHQTWS